MCNKLYFGIRPEYTRITTNYTENAFTGIVKYIEDYGNKFGVYFEVNGTEFISVCDENVPVKVSPFLLMPETISPFW